MMLTHRPLAHFQPMFHCFTSTHKPLKTSENRRFSDVFRGYMGGTLVENGLKKFLLLTVRVSNQVYINFCMQLLLLLLFSDYDVLY